MPLLKPLPADSTPELADDFALFESILGFVPNSLLTMQRRPTIVKAFGQLTRAVMAPDGAVDPGFKRLIAHMASTGAGCRYCQAHSLLAAEIQGISREKLEALWEFRTNPEFSDPERAALEFAIAAGSVPNAVDGEIMENLRRNWEEDQIVEILAAICLYGFLNRWNDSMATELEQGPASLARDLLGEGQWDAGKHGPAED